MKKLLLSASLSMCYLLLFAQQDSSLNMSLLYNWSVDTLPSSSGIRYNDIWGYVDCDGREYAIMGSASYIHFFDVNDPANAFEVASFAGGENTVWRDMKTYRDRAYSVADATNEGLMIFDLSDLPNSVTKTYQDTEFFGNAHNIFIDELHARLYVVGSNGVANMIVLDISSPDDPVLLANVTLPGGGNIHDVYVRDNIAYVSHEWRGFYAWDMTDPTMPRLLGSIETGNYNHSSWVTDDGRYAIYAEEVPTGLPLGVIDMEAPGGFEIIKKFKFPLLSPNQENNTPHNPFIRGDYAIVSYYHDGLQIFDISDIENPQQVAFYDTHENTFYSGYRGNWGTYPFLPSGNILASDISRGLFILRADNITFDPTPGGTPDATLTLEGDDTICESETAKLSLPENAKSFSWFKDNNVIPDATTNELEVSESGNYYGVATNGHCSAVSIPQDIEVKESPDVSAVMSGDTSFCPYDSLVLTAPDNYDAYIWTNNGDVIPNQTNELVITESGAYQVFTFLNGCSAMSELLNAAVETEPQFALTSEADVPCFSNGDTITLIVTPDNLNYTWFVNDDEYDSSGNQVRVEYQSGDQYRFTGETATCIYDNDNFVISAPTPVVPSISEMNGTLQSSDAASYQWLLNGDEIPDATDANYTPSSSGDYTVRTVDSNGCTATSEVFTFTVTSTFEKGLSAATRLQPNPFNSSIQIWLPDALLGKQMTIKVYENTGKVLVVREINTQQNQVNLDLTKLAEGFYWLQLQSEDGLQIVKKAVKH